MLEIDRDWQLASKAMAITDTILNLIFVFFIVYSFR
jgi:hypothetical protein